MVSGLRMKLVYLLFFYTSCGRQARMLAIADTVLAHPSWFPGKTKQESCAIAKMTARCALYN